MAYTVTKLINDAYYASGIVSREFETVQGTQLNDGFGFLNDIIADKAVEEDMIPYYKKYSFNALSGQGEYFVPGLEIAETLTFFIDSVRYQTKPVNRIAFFGSTRPENIQSLPFSWHYERTLGGSNVYLYFTPDRAYPIEIWGLFALDPVELNQDLELTLDRFYINYLKYSLAERLCSEFNFTVPIGVANQLTRYRMMISSRSAPLDLRMQKISTISGASSLSYAQINLGRGWMVP